MKDGKEGGKIFLIEVVPIVRGITKPSLSYFSSREIKVGSFVKVPVRKGFAFGLVTSVRNASTAKTDIKSANFSLKKIQFDNVIENGLPAYTIKACEKTAQYYASTLGSVLGTILPKFLLESPELLNSGSSTQAETNTLPAEPLIIQMETGERFGHYMSLIRQNFARGLSVLFLVPTAEDARRAFKVLSKGIEQYSFLLTGDMKVRDKNDAWRNARDKKHPTLLVSTPIGITFDKPDLGTIILERENSRGYRTQKRPYIHLRTFLVHLSKSSGKQLVLGDSVLSIDTLYQEKIGKYGELTPLKWRLVTPSLTTLVDMKDEMLAEKEFSLFSREVQILLDQINLEQSKIFLFGARKGLFPTTVCSDCGSVLACPKCGSPMVLHNAKSEERKIYVCHICGEHKDSTTLCDYCKSWNLHPLGIGTDRIKSAVSNDYPDLKTVVLDKEQAGAEREIKKAIRMFEDLPGTVLVGTELALLHIKETPYSAIVSLDALFSIPDYNINERIFYLISRIRELTIKETIIQTRNIGKTVIFWSAQGNIADFYRSEIEERENLFYPPFALFIKVDCYDLNDKVKLNQERLARQFKVWQPEFLAKKERGTGKTKLTMIIRVKREEWPIQELVSELSLLSHEFLIKVDPDSLL